MTDSHSRLSSLDRKVLTEVRYHSLRVLASGAAGLSWKKRETDIFLRRGWVTAEWDPPYWQWVRITPDGLRALAEGVEMYGLPDLHPARTTKVCSNCGSERRACRDCGGTYYHYEEKPIERRVAA